MRLRNVAGLGCLLVGAVAGAQEPLRATLSNGLQVVILRNTLAPVVTVEMNFKVGGNETPAGFPGTAHALEHMAFRGCTGMTADQTSAIYAQLGGQNNADTQQNITQFYATVPASDVDVALQAQAACLRGVDNTAAEWAQERGAIIQEVQRDLSNPTYKFISQLNAAMFAGTPYAHDPLGTRASFDATTAEMLSNFYKQWYTPGNAVLVIAGDVDPAATLKKVKELYSDIADHPLPKHPEVNLSAVKSDSFTLDSNLPYTLGFVSYRLPGTSSPDYAAVQILGDVLASQRGDLYAMVPAGKALAAQFGVAESYANASVGFGVVALAGPMDTNAAVAEMKKILANYAAKGVPDDLVVAARRSEVAHAEFERNSIPGLASLWSNALAAEGRNSPDEDLAALKKVTTADVNRVAKMYLQDANSITAILKPVPTGEAVSAKGFGGAETLTSAPTKPVVLPAWAEASLGKLKVPAATALPSDVVLANGIRLIVKTEKASATVSVFGAIRHEDGMQTPTGKEGVGEVLDGLYSYGTRTLDRIAFQKALDDIAANENAGYGFSVRVLKENFSRGVELLADNELQSGAAGGGVRGGEAADSAADCRAAAEPGVSHGACGERWTAAKGRSGFARAESGRREQADDRRREDLLRGDGAAGPDHDCRDWRYDAGGSARGDREVVWCVERCGCEAGHDAAEGAGEHTECGDSCGCAVGAGFGDTGGGVAGRSLFAGLLSAAAGRACAGRRLLCDAAVSRSAPGGRVCVQRRYWTERGQDAVDA